VSTSAARWSIGLALAVLTVLATARAARPFETDIGRAAIDRAIALGQSGDATSLARFNDPYTIALGGPLLVRLEVLTEFRRVVLAAREHAQFGELSWGAEEAAAMLRPFRRTVTLTLYVTLPPQNTYRSMPRFDIVLYRRPGSGTGRVEPIERMETPRYVSGQPAPPGSPILGGSIEAVFSARDIDPRGVYLAGILEAGRELRRVEVDFGRVE
jgi:hypothetical protein